ncbi:MAG: 3-phosphoshikimate 1-carboxyvinyltransferase [Burkholderiaceae bacterium]
MGLRKKMLVANGGSCLTGGLRVPGDKSISHRSVILGALADGVTRVSGFLAGEDALSTCQVFRALGVQIDGPVDGGLTIHGVGLHGLTEPSTHLDCGNAGTGMRLLIGLLAGQSFSSTLIGDESLSGRPMGRVARPLIEMGANITTTNGFPPVHITPVDSLTGRDYVMPVASAQLKSALLLAGLYARGITRVTEPAPSRDHTERMLAGFGVVTNRDGAQISIASGQTLVATTIDVPGDISSAAFFMVAASITPGSDITLEHVGVNPTRTGVIEILRAMGADISLSAQKISGGEPVADIRVKYRQLTGVEIAPGLVPLAIDEFPVIFIAAACAIGETRLNGAQELRVKESDRIAAMAQGMTALGISVQPTEDGMRIPGLADATEQAVFSGGEVDSFGDHRIAMAFAVASLRADGPVHIADTANVATSFPGFCQAASQLGLLVHEAQG